MPSSNKPRAAMLPRRSGRPPKPEQIHEGDADDEFPPCDIFVEGISRINYWDQPLRNDYDKFCALATKFRFFVQERPVDNNERARRVWTRKRVALDLAFAAIRDKPGILFDEWSLRWLNGSPDVPVTRIEARRKAAVGLSRLVAKGRIEKRYDDNGNLMLFPHKQGAL